MLSIETRGGGMGKLYLLFKTDEIVKKEIVAANESLEVVTEYLNNNQELDDPVKLGQGWEIDLLTYDDTGKTNLTLINKHAKELEKCKPEDIQENTYYNIVYKDNTVQDPKRLDTTKKVCKMKCIKVCPPKFIFVNRKVAGLHLRYDDIIVIAKCRENEDSDDTDRFIYYSHLYQWKMEHCDF